MSTVSANVMQVLSNRLQQRREQLSAQLRQRLHQADEQQEMALFNNYAIDADLAEASQLSDTDIALLNHELLELRSVDNALGRLHHGGYGQCSHCGEAILEARLLAQPEAEMCRDCQTELELRGGSKMPPR
ncbi:hypothetical protein GTP81_28385 [Rugamonas sp. FT107W]|uniref:Zinc finger DksA/TraR C4-type domain-containing protein n=1 Tax=Duganella vulcania TaxID=2692166 RepID=A0A845HV37_9BURK|nr:TraR/DksA family transcriptional regulator [Duganella vulcania]MYN20664.1 hypothetical protein [Duganella vulcania]